MSSAPHTVRVSLREYFDREYVSLEKHEYRDGEMLAMAGGTPNHSLITLNVGGELRQLLKGKSCTAFDSNLRVGIPPSVLFTYPDVSVICGTTVFDANDPKRQTVINPKVVIEILSPTTEAYDRGEKFNRYRRLASLEEYVLVSQDVPRVESFLRQRDTLESLPRQPLWLFSVTEGLTSSVLIRSLNVAIPLSEIYRGVELKSPDELSSSTGTPQPF